MYCHLLADTRRPMCSFVWLLPHIWQRHFIPMTKTLAGIITAARRLIHKRNPILRALRCPFWSHFIWLKILTQLHIKKNAEIHLNRWVPIVPVPVLRWSTICGIVKVLTVVHNWCVAWNLQGTIKTVLRKHLSYFRNKIFSLQKWKTKKNNRFKIHSTETIGKCSFLLRTCSSNFLLTKF